MAEAKPYINYFSDTKIIYTNKMFDINKFNRTVLELVKDSNTKEFIIQKLRERMLHSSYMLAFRVPEKKYTFELAITSSGLIQSGRIPKNT